jgi:PAS domain-containing protein
MLGHQSLRMPHKEIEMILARQLADCLALPVLLVDADRTLVFYNEPAEKIIGLRFEETGAMPTEDWLELFLITDGKGHALEPGDRPLMRALTQREPAQSTLWIRGGDHKEHCIQATTLPLLGRGGRFLGAMAIFWEAGPK